MTTCIFWKAYKEKRTISNLKICLLLQIILAISFLPYTTAADGSTIKESASGVTVVGAGVNNTYWLNDMELRRILLRDDIKDLPVAVVSIAGPYRGGKSFMLSFFLRYLYSDETSRVNGSWLGDDHMLLKGFSWRGGSERHTTGIIMWSEPFVSTLPSGEKVAVLLMDTQGTFDSSSTIRDCSTIFALSTLISSVQIYNLRGNIQENDLQYLQLFAEYGNLLRQDQGKAFQELKFLIRDWPYPFEYPYGAAGGEQLLDKRFKVTESQPEEMRKLREHIRSCFESISCFLMPHPGMQVFNTSFQGRLDAIGEEFKQSLKELVPLIIGSSNLVPKSIAGERIKTGDLYDYFKTYVQIFSSDDVPTPETIFQATAQASLLNAMKTARDQYDTAMDSEFGASRPSVYSYVIHQYHDNELTAAVETFKSKKKMGPKAIIDQNQAKLTEGITNELQRYLNMNSAKFERAKSAAQEAYQKYFDGITKGQNLLLKLVDLENVHKNAYNAAVNAFDSNRRQVKGIPDMERTEFLKNIESRLSEMNSMNELNHNTVILELVAAYTDNMLNYKSKHDPPQPYYFYRQHLVEEQIACNTLSDRRNFKTSSENDRFEAELVKKIYARYAELKPKPSDGNYY